MDIKFRLVGKPYRTFTSSGEYYCCLAFLNREEKDPEIVVLVFEDEVFGTFSEWCQGNDRTSPGGPKGPLWDGCVKEWEEVPGMVFSKGDNPYSRTLFATLTWAKAGETLPFTEKQVAFVKGGDWKKFIFDFVEKAYPPLPESLSHNGVPA